jgi:hypothetical protein
MGEPTRRRRSAMSERLSQLSSLRCINLAACLSIHMDSVWSLDHIVRFLECTDCPSACYIDRSQTLPVMKFFP